MPLSRAYRTPATPSAIQPISTAARKPPSVFAIGIILTLALFAPLARAEDPPASLAKLVAHRETETEAERNEYMYRQTVTIDELDATARRGGRIARSGTLSSPQHERTKRPSGEWRTG